MYAVIFKAKITTFDASYTEIAKKMRELAMDKYGCSDFVSATEDGYEIAISYWETQEQIIKWKQDAEHLVAQELGRSRWYQSYKVEVVKIIREYPVGKVEKNNFFL